MTKEDQIVALFARANPVPSLDLLDPVEPLDMENLASLSERSSVMTDIETIQPKKEERRTRPRLVPALVIVAIALVAIPIVLNRQIFVGEPETPVKLAVAWMDALNTHDGNAAAALMAPDGLYDGEEPSMIPGWFDYDRAIGSVYSFEECVETSSGPDGTVVECPILQEDDRTRALLLEPSPGRYEFLVEEGQIRSADSYLDNGGDYARAWQAFDVWLRENQNLDLTTMYIMAGVPERSPEALVLWEQYVDEFVASQGG